MNFRQKPEWKNVYSALHFVCTCMYRQKQTKCGRREETRVLGHWGVSSLKPIYRFVHYIRTIPCCTTSWRSSSASIWLGLDENQRKINWNNIDKQKLLRQTLFDIEHNRAYRERAMTVCLKLLLCSGIDPAIPIFSQARYVIVFLLLPNCISLSFCVCALPWWMCTFGLESSFDGSSLCLLVSSQ